MRQRERCERTLYDPRAETDACGFGLIAHLRGTPSRRVVADALGMLERMAHRGAVAADGLSGDGCGILLALPVDFVRDAARRDGITLAHQFAVGMVAVFDAVTDVKAMIERHLTQAGLDFAGWRFVPTTDDVLGDGARESRPEFWQALVNLDASGDIEETERRLYAIRRQLDRVLGRQAYVLSFSSRRIAYKALVLPANLPKFFPDLANPALKSGIAVVHQRFSTNTNPDWRLAQPFRLLAHNGEINTIAGNRGWARARAAKFADGAQQAFGIDRPHFEAGESDSASLDAMVEFLLASGMPLALALRTLMPPAWQNVADLPPALRAFFQFYSLNTDPWDGPACIVLTDGRRAAAAADRNGLRPARWLRTVDDVICLASEAGVLDVPAADIVEKGRLGPGDLMIIDTEDGSVRTRDRIDADLAQQEPYQQWLRDRSVRLEPVLRSPKLTENPVTDEELEYLERLFDLGFEEREQVLKVLADSGKEAVGSMGDDTPIAVMSSRPRPLYDYLRQRFAQVTNPPIDPIREAIVMSLETNFGPETAFFSTDPAQADRVIAESPVLSEDKFRQIQMFRELPCATIRLALKRGERLRAALDRLSSLALERARQGKRILILDDRPQDRHEVPVHAALALGAIHQDLARAGVRCSVNIIAATATARDPHHIGCLLALGATAVYPYLAYQSLAGMARRGDIDVGDGAAGHLGRAYRKGINAGLYKILSKIGISTMWSFRGARQFEVLGLHREVVERCFAGAEFWCIDGADFDWLERQAQEQFAAAQRQISAPNVISGRHKFSRGGEYHAWHPGVVHALQRAVASGDWADYQDYARLIDDRAPMSLRDLLRVRSPQPALGVDEVEDEVELVQRFESAGMSLGALSPEAHETLALAMNRLGGRSNSGEGGEEPRRSGTEWRSKIRQVASGRFGVTAEYLNAAEVIQIKIAQGAKPGEGGQLPGHKVDARIARLRFARPGIGLISPPPHHDIYSIEDLAELIHDLKELNPTALIAVKLVARRGIGTIAVGVAKAHADIITVSGFDGGTGASPLSSVKYAGSPWELGLAEVQQALVANGLRERVRLQADGGLKTGLDVIKAALLGAGTFGFGTAPMVAMGCKYLRICHLNNCATGVATQNEVLRRDHFHGTAEKVENYFRFLALDVRQRLAALGARTLREIIGRSEWLEAATPTTAQQELIDLEPMLAAASIRDSKTSRRNRWARNRRLHKTPLADQIALDTAEAVRAGDGGVFRYRIANHNRAIGAKLAGAMVRAGSARTAPLVLELEGSAGQSLGAWCVDGLEIHLTGEANDHVGKGMHGGRITLRPPSASEFAVDEAPIAGNVCLYGATGGELYAAGTVGERFAVRNSGATAVVQGVGDHGCEYMTGGVIAVLGRTGRNFGAGMTGGFAYVLDTDRHFVDRYNTELVDIQRMVTESMEAHVYHLRELLEAQAAATGSERARTILDDLRDYLPLFWLVKPKATDIGALLDELNRAA